MSARCPSPGIGGGGGGEGVEIAETLSLTERRTLSLTESKWRLFERWLDQATFAALPATGS